MAQKWGHLANAEPLPVVACLICDDPDPAYSWTDYSGEAYCVSCGTPYQIKWGELREGESYPRINVRMEAIPALRRFYAETGSMNGCGTYLGMDLYPEQYAGQQRMAQWWREHKEEYPELIKERAP